jgi:glycosyltransferase involved in cell wall biosynthesis
MVEKDRGQPPFFSIGVTTYNRRDLLQQTLNSILNQTFADFEVIVGNDYQAEILNGEMLGISDPRIRFVNHPHNLQEVGNMNALLAMASGRYFTWLADDDLYEPDFLRTAHDLLAKNGFPPGFFSSYRVIQGMEAPAPQLNSQSSVWVLTGREFLGRYFAGRLKIISTCGLFDTDRLRSVVGGVEELCDAAVGLYGEYIFLVRCAQFEKIIYSEAPLVLYRMHDGAWGCTNLELDKYRQAGAELVRRSGQVLRHPSLSGDLTKHLVAICDMHVHAYAAKLGRRNVVQGNFGAGAMYRAIMRLFTETANVHRSFMEAGRVARLRATLVFAWLRCKYSLLIVKILVENWVRQPSSHD